MKAQDWTVHAVANSALMYGHADPAWARDWDGWTYVDTFSEANPRFAALSRAAAAANRTAGPGEAGAYDMGRLLAEGIARAPELTRAGIRAGLERVKALPAATGRAGTLMGFGNWDRGALKGYESSDNQDDSVKVRSSAMKIKSLELQVLGGRLDSSH